MVLVLELLFVNKNSLVSDTVIHFAHVLARIHSAFANDSFLPLLIQLRLAENISQTSQYLSKIYRQHSVLEYYYLNPPIISIIYLLQSKY